MPYADPEKQRAAEAAYRRRHPENHVVRRLRRRCPGARVSIRDVRALIAVEPSCAYCGAPARHVDHATPLVRGGSGGVENLVMACQGCNLSKGTRTVLEFLCLWPGEVPF
jgi:5-methylcytosine-specific restriction endonuclease McrA